MIIKASHPAAVVHVPARSRTERIDLVTLRTPVRLRVVDPGAMAPDGFGPPWSRLAVFRPFHGTWHVMDGALWQPLGCGRVTPFQAEAGPAIGTDAFVAYLEGRADGGPDLEARFAGTPLAARTRSRSLMPFTEHWSSTRTVDPVDLGGSREIVHDTRDRARQAIQDFLDAEVAVAGGTVFTRLKPVLSMYRLGHPGGGRRAPLWNQALPGHDILAVTAATAAAAQAYADRLHPKGSQDWASGDPAAEAWLDTPLGAGLEGDGHRLVADSAPAALRRQIDNMLPIYRQTDDPRLGAALADRRAMIRLEAEGMTGMAGTGDLEAALVAILSASEGLGPAAAWGTPHMARAVRELYLPTLPRPPVPSEDAEALALAIAP